MTRGNVLLFSAVLLVFVIEESTAGLLDGLNGSPIAGPCDIIVKNFESCPKKISGANGFRFTNIKIYHRADHPTDFIMNANVSLDFPLDDNILVSVNMAEWTKRGGWKTGAHSLNFHQMCSTFKLVAGKMWENVLVALYGNNQLCPLPSFKNRRLYKNMTMKSEDIALKEMIYGRWRSDLTFIQQGSNVVKGCVRLTTEAIPKTAP